MKKRAFLALSIAGALAVAVAGILTTVALVPDVALPFKTGGTAEVESGKPALRDGALFLEQVAEGLQFPTSMAFLDANNILVLQKNDGQVRLVSGGELVEQPVLQVAVENKIERGLLGIAVWNGSSATSNEVFLYLTENVTGDGGNAVAMNRIYKYNYDWDQRALVNGTLLLDLAGGPGPYHNGGKIIIGPDGYLYAVIGDTNDSRGISDNDFSDEPPDFRSVIVRVDRETGEAPGDNPFYGTEGLEKAYAYGIRNSFGMDFDPVTNSLWMTENGPTSYDEINVVPPGFNSGWDKFTGPIARSNATMDDLVMVKGARYGDPAFSWYIPVGVTDIEFFDSEKLGEKYRDNIFVGDVNNGNLYFFEADQNRTGLYFGYEHPGLADLIADPVPDKDTGRLDGELPSITFGKGFAAITDIETGPDGYLYVLTHIDGKIYRITAAGAAGQQ
ncbi:PQQ-dependent sugar dehydrogenase [Nitrososphaera viennensis]|uniref:PQQ-dependent sugar dehydrogenase n=2 Tax=Nitrososphaera viennensis TaxID=1034015 RepID=A0A977IFX9_9ARCH|nr:PQQ-dependent sugar dehydrogenase [Nitrososphaera viennensis]AIC15406.1 putative quinoprotein glucose/ sorbosone dehydrogenase [Nitrososphaera viennensis EN76]UVS70299.1 PQQ-dependent sugar dehydrogenase [Nitrososphaera viennensis]